MKSFTDIEQSRKLANILPLESADMWYWEWPTAPQYNNYERPMPHKGEGIVNVPCWSLVALLSVLPNGIVMNKDSQNGKYHFSSTYIGTHITADNPIDACVAMIIRLNELNLL